MIQRCSVEFIKLLNFETLSLKRNWRRTTTTSTTASNTLGGKTKDANVTSILKLLPLLLTLTPRFQ